MKNVKVNDDECVGCGTCVEIAEDVFRMGPEDKAEAYGNVTVATRIKSRKLLTAAQFRQFPGKNDFFR